MHKFGWLVVLEFNATLTAKVISWRSVMHMCFLAFLKKLQNTCTTLNDTVQNMSHDQENLKTKLLESEFRNMIDNLIFYGIPMGSSHSGTMSENCDNLVKLHKK